MEKVPLTDVEIPESDLSPPQQNLLSRKESDASGSKTAITELGEQNNFQSTVDLSPSTNKGSTLYFRDGVRRIDYVLSYSVSSKKAIAAKRAERRAGFEIYLQQIGVDLEHEPPSGSFDGKTGFVKLHGTWNFLENQAEILKIRMPLKGSDMKVQSRLEGALEKCLKYNPCKLPDKIVHEEPQYYTAVYDRRYPDQFAMTDKETFFSAAQRSRMLWEALLRAEFGAVGEFGIKRLIDDGCYDGAYPLHEEMYSKGDKPSVPTERHVLYEHWAHPSQWFKYQPLNLIRKYFGEKITIYFAWLGFYTKALMPAAIAGFVCILYGLVTLSTDTPSNDICDANGAGSKIMCPNGPITKGDTWELKDSCRLSKVTYVFDNVATVIFAVFMSIWATMFLEGWKRRQAELAWDWDMHEADMEEEALRPEYINGVKTVKRNPVTGVDEPYLPFSSRVIRIIGSSVTVIFFLSLVLAFMFAVIVYRTIMTTLFEQQVKLPNSRAIIVTSVTAAALNLIVIIIMDFVYQWLAWHLTNWEFPRTEQQFEDSYTFKVFLFQFINYYSSLVYVAFFKGRFISVVETKADGVFGEVCDPAGCMVELLIQLSIIMVGKQFLNNVMEILFPIVMNRWRRWRALPTKSASGNSRWEKDYHLNELPNLAMFGEYMEMVLQYGFVTLFVAAFPLAPFFALINNVMEIRLDAYKFLGTYRRPMPARAKDLGVWYRILDAISHLAVLTNACVIAFTSDFVPKMYYKFRRAMDNSLVGYVDFSLSYYDTRIECVSSTIMGFNSCKQPYCYYRDSRLPPCSLQNMTTQLNLTAFDRCDDKYSYSVDWWHIMVARLAFVLIFEHVVFLFKGIMAYLIPDVPRYIVIQMQREHFLTKKALYSRAYTVAGKTDADPATVAADDVEAAGDETPENGTKPANNGSTPSLNRSEFRYSPTESAASSDDEESNRKKKKFPNRRL